MLSQDAEVMELLNRLARMAGCVFGIEIGVDESGDKLIFVDAAGEPIMLDGKDMIAASLSEIKDGTHLDNFFGRAGDAAVVAKYQEIERMRTP